MSKQLVLALVILLGVNVTAQARGKSFKPTYKVENCDCLGVDQDIPTFLSDIAGNLDIEALATSRRGAEKKADKMCVQAYRDFASEDDTYAIKSSYQVSSTGCQVFKSTRNGDWKAI